MTALPSSHTHCLHWLQQSSSNCKFGFKYAASPANPCVSVHRLAFKLAFQPIYSLLMINVDFLAFSPELWKISWGGKWSGTFSWVLFVTILSFPLQMLSIIPMSSALLRNEQSQDNLSLSSVHTHTNTHVETGPVNTRKRQLLTVITLFLFVIQYINTPLLLSSFALHCCISKNATHLKNLLSLFKSMKKWTQQLVLFFSALLDSRGSPYEQICGVRRLFRSDGGMMDGWQRWSNGPILSPPPCVDANLCIWFQLVAIKMVLILS